MQKAEPQASAGSVFAESCLACHSTATATVSGGGFTLDRVLNDRDWRKVLTRTYKGEMPPQGNKKGIPPLKDEAFAKLVEESEASK